MPTSKLAYKLVTESALQKRDTEYAASLASFPVTVRSLTVSEGSKVIHVLRGRREEPS